MVLGLGAYAAFAEDAVTNTAAPTAPTALTAPMMVNIGPAGNVLLRGTITGAPGTDSLVVKSWGGSWTINVLSSTNILSSTKTLADFKDGDVVGVLGSISADGDFSIDARILRAWGHRPDDDHDGIANNQDNDADNDGLPDKMDPKPDDHDNDGTIDSTDTDDDADGILDTEDSHLLDHDNDGIPDARERHHGRDPFMMMGIRGGMDQGNHGPGHMGGEDDPSGSGSGDH